MEMITRILKLFSPSGSHTILVFRTTHYGNIPTGTGVSNAGGYEKSRFSTNISLLHEWWSAECFQQITAVEYVDNTNVVRLCL